MVYIMVFCQIIVIHTYFLKREETTPITLYVSRVVQPDDTDPTLREKCIYYISQLVINDNNVGNRLGHVVFDNDDDDDDDDDDAMTIVMGRGREHQRPVVKKQLQVRPRELLL
ncbi:hypothetical protein C1646_809415 [Rhizophagus diaphanus]|nr:hypothetical protein C1646_809415 [Rhizophagus diaphanus] [Rhizophagus sp. MUCL 43196]